MTILLAYTSGLPDRDDPYISLLPSGLCYLHATLREAGFESLLANFSGWSEVDVTRTIERLRPGVVAISQWTHNRHASMELARSMRRLNPGCTIIMGGGHATFRHEDALRQGSPVDLVVMGEGEETLLEVVRRIAAHGDWRDIEGIAYRLDGAVVVTRSRELLTDLDRLPFASRHLEESLGVDVELQAEFVVTARGCPASCNFCSSPRFWRRQVRFRSPEHIVAEILYIRERYGLIYFSLRDDTFTADRSRALSICRLLMERRAQVIWNCQSRATALDEELLLQMKRAGCECVQLGVESGSPRMLALLGKTVTPAQVERAAAMIRRVGISLSVYLISDIPGETDADRGATIELMRRIKPDDGYVSPLAYFPGTTLFLQGVAEGRVDAGVFHARREPAVFVGGKPGRAASILLKALASRAEPSARAFERQKRLLGYCHTTNVIAGEYYRQVGNIAAAEREFREIVEREPDNPWGWFLLGELLEERGLPEAASDCYRKVLKRVPAHLPALRALGRKKRSR